MKKENQTAKNLNIWEHIGELRSKFLYSFVVFVVGTLIAHHFHEQIISFILHPIQGNDLFFLSPLDPLFFIFKIDAFVGLILALPVIGLSIFSFIKPAMARSTWIVFSIIFASASILIMSALVYVFLVMAPISIKFLLSITVAGIQNIITASSYINFLLAQTIIMIIVFQMPLIIISMAYLGIINVRMIAKKRRIIYVSILIILAIVTPTTDLFSLAIVAVPALLIFEVSVVCARFVPLFKAKIKDKDETQAN